MNKYDEEGCVYNISDPVRSCYIWIQTKYEYNNICKLHLFCIFIIS